MLDLWIPRSMIWIVEDDSDISLSLIFTLWLKPEYETTPFLMSQPTIRDNSYVFGGIDAVATRAFSANGNIPSSTSVNS